METALVAARCYLIAAGIVALLGVFIARGGSKVDKTVFRCFLGLGLGLVAVGISI